MDNIWADSFSEIRELSLHEKKEEKKAGKPKRWWDDDGDGIGYEKGEVGGKFKKTKKEELELQERKSPIEMALDTDKKLMKIHTKDKPAPKGYAKKDETKKEERELSSKKNSTEKLDVMSGKNKIEINPKLSEEIQAWIEHLIDEGYDLSQFTPDEIIDIYEGVVIEEQQDSTQLAMAKAQAARAKVKKEREDLRVAQMQQKTKYDASESVIAFVNSRTPLFEGVYDPKKTKLRPASERAKNAMTDAQRKAAKKEADRVSAIHSKGETVLAGLRSSGKSRKVGTSAPKAKESAPEANRKVSGKKDKLASTADKILKDLRK